MSDANDDAPCYCAETSTRNCPRHQNMCSCCPGGDQPGGAHDPKALARLLGADYVGPFQVTSGAFGAEATVETWASVVQRLVEAETALAQSLNISHEDEPLRPALLRRSKNGELDETPLALAWYAALAAHQDWVDERRGQPYPPPVVWGDAPLLVYEAWGAPGYAASTISTQDGMQDMSKRGLFDEGEEPLFSLRAWSWREAMETYHELQGWEPYRPSDHDPCRNCFHPRGQHHADVAGGQRQYQCWEQPPEPAGVRCGCLVFVEPLVYDNP
jgi:hypothetical protein